MKNIKVMAIALLAIVTFSCKETKKEKEEAAEVAVNKFTLLGDSTKVSFTAYKTTEKLPVGGVFKTIKINESFAGSTPTEALDGTEFSIPVSSLFTNDATGTRDPKLLEFFFGAMADTDLIAGKLNMSEDGKASISVTLNGKTNTVALETTKNSDTSFAFNGVLNLEDFDALAAVESINKACEALHTGPDGVSKTWSEVAIKAEVTLTETK